MRNLKLSSCICLVQIWAQYFVCRVSDYLPSSSLFLRKTSFQELVGIAEVTCGLRSGSVSAIFLYFLVKVAHMPSPQICPAPCRDLYLWPGQVHRMQTFILIHMSFKKQVFSTAWGCHCLLGPKAAVLGHRVTSDT